MALKLQFENIGNYCAAFRLKNFYISDNKYLFIVPQENFCRLCFLRRYVTQMNVANINQISDSALNLARRLDDNFKQDGAWHVYSIAEQKLAKSFALTPYEDCPMCAKQDVFDATQAGAVYAQLLEQESAPRLEALRQQVFSFGYARIQVTSDKIGFTNPEFDKLLGGNYQTSTIYRVVTADGRHADESAMGVASDKSLAELKSIMEYLERYAFMLQLCRFKTTEFDEQIINRYLEQYRPTASATEKNHIKSQAGWGINLATKEVRAIPLAFIFNKGQVDFIRPTSSGFGAHTDFRKSLCSSILELVERDAFVRFWHDPQRAFKFKPDANVQSEIDSIVSILKDATGNESLQSNCFVVQSPTRLPVAMITISTQDFATPPTLSFGCGVGFNLREALAGALNELRGNAINLVKAITHFDGFMKRVITTKIESIPDRMSFYSTCAPRAKLRFLDNENPLVDGIVEDADPPCLDILVDRFKQIGFDIYGLDCTPRSFQDKNVFVTRAFSPQLYPLQFEQEDGFALPTGSISAHKELPHFFL